MTDADTREAVRQALADWNAATGTQRAAASEAAARAADVTTTITKIAWRRDPDIPAGKPADGTFTCVCRTVIGPVPFGGPDSTCPGCGRVWDGHGWAVEGRQS